ncbi:alpha/beta fold hydrolase [Xylanimonas allomyrinae]|uniref:alpha/beta fold hydrolase n=1 Tax=Xylanimonas allomyrinae TaxID=2509459 RepID=UPI003CCC4A0C
MVFDGAGPAVVVLHGLAGSASEMVPTAQALEGRKVVLVDLRGHGRSTRRPGDLSREAYVRDVVRVIEREANEPVDLVGQSMGRTRRCSRRPPGRTWCAGLCFWSATRAVARPLARPGWGTSSVPGRCRSRAESRRCRCWAGARWRGRGLRTSRNAPEGSSRGSTRMSWRRRSRRWPFRGGSSGRAWTRPLSSSTPLTGCSARTRRLRSWDVVAA